MTLCDRRAHETGNHRQMWRRLHRAEVRIVYIDNDFHRRIEAQLATEGKRRPRRQVPRNMFNLKLDNASDSGTVALAHSNQKAEGASNA